MPQLRRGGGHGEGPSDCTPNSPGVMSGGRAELCAGPARRLLADECLISAPPTHCPQEPPLHTQEVLLSPRGDTGPQQCPHAHSVGPCLGISGPSPQAALPQDRLPWTGDDREARPIPRGLGGTGQPARGSWPPEAAPTTYPGCHKLMSGSTQTHVLQRSPWLFQPPPRRFRLTRASAHTTACKPPRCHGQGPVRSASCRASLSPAGPLSVSRGR